MSEEHKMIPNSTQTPNIILDKYIKELSGAEFKVLMFLVRKTFGWGKEKDWITNKYAKEQTGLAGGTVSEALKTLIDKEIVVAKNNDGNLLRTTRERQQSGKNHRKIYYSLSITVHSGERAFHSSEKDAVHSSETTKQTHIDKTNSKQEDVSADKFTKEDKEYKLAKKLKNYVDDNSLHKSGPDLDSSSFQNWCTAIDRLHRLGPHGEKNNGYSFDEIEDLIDFSQNHDFWWRNILSAIKLRKQAPKLEAQMSEAKDNNNSDGDNFEYYS